jgi:hypothetical protein
LPIFCDFLPIFVWFFANFLRFLATNANIFAKFFCENIFKNHYVGPRSGSLPVTATIRAPCPRSWARSWTSVLPRPTCHGSSASTASTASSSASRYGSFKGAFTRNNPKFGLTNGVARLLGAIYQKWENYTKSPQNIPNGHHIYQMAVK